MLEKKTKKGQRGKGFLLGVPFVGKLAKPMITIFFLVQEKEDIDDEKKYCYDDVLLLKELRYLTNNLSWLGMKE